MENENEIEIPRGILTSMSWHSNKWNGTAPTKDDLTMSNFEFTQEYKFFAEYANFAHKDKDKLESDDFYIGYSPTMKLSSSNYPVHRESIIVIFIKSLNYHDGKHYVVGLYAFPIIANKIHGNDNEYFYRKWDDYPGQFKSKHYDIHFLNHPAEIDNNIVFNRELLTDKKLPNTGFAYMYKLNIEKMLDYLISKNPGSSKLIALSNKIKNAL
jgi:hypothetical protein